VGRKAGITGRTPIGCGVADRRPDGRLAEAAGRTPPRNPETTISVSATLKRISALRLSRDTQGKLSGLPWVAIFRLFNPRVFSPRLSHKFLPLCPAPRIDTAGGISARACLSEVSFRARRPCESVDEASIMLSGKAASEARRAAIDRL
jgi:hypothetical protein